MICDTENSARESMVGHYGKRFLQLLGGNHNAQNERRDRIYKTTTCDSIGASFPRPLLIAWRTAPMAKLSTG